MINQITLIWKDDTADFYHDGFALVDDVFSVLQSALSTSHICVISKIYDEDFKSLS